MYRKTLKISILFIYLIIIAGAVVRMTGSGMGCPDWPKCFGYLIPPTEESELIWEAQRDYKSGQVIIVNEALRVAEHDFTSGTTYSPENWEAYEAHDYAVFNVWHTWIEYVNRLITALAGIPILLMIYFSFSFWRGYPKKIVASFSVLLLMGFQSWLGKEVVDSNLLPVKITIHMVVALFILALLMYLWFVAREKEEGIVKHTKRTRYYGLFQNLIIIATLLTVIQIAFGTQVRQYIDNRVDEVGYAAKELWLTPMTIWFYIHRSFSILVSLLGIYLFWLNKKHRLGYPLINWVLICIGVEAFSGIIMYYVDFPFGSQPLHLVIASLLFGIQFYVLLESWWKTKQVSMMSNA